MDESIIEGQTQGAARLIQAALWQAFLDAAKPKMAFDVLKFARDDKKIIPMYASIFDYDEDTVREALMYKARKTLRA